MLCVLIVLSLNSITYMSLSFGCVLVVNIVVNMCVCVCACEWVGECLELAHVQGQRHTNDIDASGVFYKLNCSH